MLLLITDIVLIYFYQLGAKLSMKYQCKQLLLSMTLLWQVLLFAGCDSDSTTESPQQPVQQVPVQQVTTPTVPVPFRNQDSHERYDEIGKLGTHPISIPAGVTRGAVIYRSNPSKFADRKIKTQYTPPPISYTFPIKSFRFRYRIRDGDVYTTSGQTEQDYYRDNKTSIPSDRPIPPWADVIVYDQYNDAVPLNFNSTIQDDFRVSKKVTNIDYIQQAQPLYGLTVYLANNGIDPETGEPWKSNTVTPDRMINKDKAGNIKTYIQREFTQQTNFCRHRFYNDEWHIQIWIIYNCTYLPQWRKIEGNIIKILNSWRVTQKGKLLSKQIGKA